MKLTPLGNVHIDELLGKTVRAGYRALRLRSGLSPETHSCHGEAGGGVLAYEAFSPLDIQQIIYAILTDEQIAEFERAGVIDLPYSVACVADFSVHVVRTKAGVEADFLVVRSPRPEGQV